MQNYLEGKKKGKEKGREERKEGGNTENTF